MTQIPLLSLPRVGPSVTFQHSSSHGPDRVPLLPTYPHRIPNTRNPPILLIGLPRAMAKGCGRAGCSRDGQGPAARCPIRPMFSGGQIRGVAEVKFWKNHLLCCSAYISCPAVMAPALPCLKEAQCASWPVSAQTAGFQDNPLFQRWQFRLTFGRFVVAVEWRACALARASAPAPHATLKHTAKHSF